MPHGHDSHPWWVVDQFEEAWRDPSNGTNRAGWQSGHSLHSFTARSVIPVQEEGSTCWQYCSTHTSYSSHVSTAHVSKDGSESTGIDQKPNRTSPDGETNTS